MRGIHVRQQKSIFLLKEHFLPQTWWQIRPRSADGMKAKCYTRLFRNQTGKLYSAFPLVLHILTVRGSIADMQTCGVLRMISGITGSFLRICSGDVSYDRIM